MFDLSYNSDLSPSPDICTECLSTPSEMKLLSAITKKKMREEISRIVAGWEGQELSCRFHMSAIRARNKSQGVGRGITMAAGTDHDNLASWTLWSPHFRL